MYINAIYFNCLILFVVAILVVSILYIASFLIGHRMPDKEKISAYECGFNPFEDARQKFDIRFYLVAILFIIFDLEVVFIFPWAVAVFFINFWGIISMLIFLFVLTVGFIYEWVSGALDWE